MWKEEHEGTRINQKRFDQISVANPKTLAVGCPFCMTMFEDGINGVEANDRLRVRDIAELVAAAMATETKAETGTD